MKRHKKQTLRPTAKNQKTQRVKRTKDVAPRSAEEFFAKSREFQETWNRILHAISRMRADGFSLSRASREYGIDRRKVLKLAGHALRKTKGSYVAKASDRLLRILVVPTPDGLREIPVRDSRQASQLAEYWDAVQRYLQKGDESELRKFHGKQIKDAAGQPIRLLTNREELDRLGSAGVLSFESLYARAA
jgi:hypothetical protein